MAMLVQPSCAWACGAQPARLLVANVGDSAALLLTASDGEPSGGGGGGGGGDGEASGGGGVACEFVSAWHRPAERPEEQRICVTPTGG